MGEAFITRRGGGVAGLNFRVIDGTARPSSQKENDIWVNTGIKVSSYDFAAEMPFLRSNNKNKIVYPFYHTTKTEDGITWTDNGDGSITANGTATGNALFRISAFVGAADHEYLEAGTYTLSGCPAGGSDSAYLMELFILDPVTNANEAIGRDYGEGFTFTLERGCKVRVNLNVMSGTTVSGIVFKPQIEKGSAATAFVKGDATGQVWISNGTSSGVEFNALKKNGLFVYPVVVWQYKYGKWSTTHAEIFKNGQWVQFSSVFSATIVITYPAGSTCTCSDGVTTLTAPDTSGTWECIVPNTGTWIVSCTDGNNTSSTDVIITTDGQSENVGVSYLEYVFQNGAFTKGSWGKFTTSTVVSGTTYTGAVTLENKELHVKAVAQTKGIFYTTEKFNTRGKKEIVFTVTKITNYNAGSKGKIHFGIAATQADDSFVAEIFVDAISSSKSQEFVVPINAEHYGDYYIKAGLIRDVMFEDNVWISEIKMQ